MYYGIAIIPSQNVQEVANSYRKRYDPHYKLIAPHITLREKFMVSSEESLHTLVESLSSVAQSTPSFSLTISKYSTFYPVNNVIYLAIEESAILNELYQKLQDSDKLDDRPYPFIPHITIAQKLDTDELLDVYAGIRGNEVNFEFEVDRFHLFKQEQDLKWSIYKTFELTGKSSI